MNNAAETQRIDLAQRGDASALEEVVSHYRSLVIGLSFRFHLSSGAPVSRDELVQAGYVGLLMAIRRYD